MELSYRYIARITIEAETPIAVGSGEKGLNTDRLVAKDANGLPYIPATGLVGVLRHSFKQEDWVDEVFGSGGNDGKGSRLILSSAFLVGEDGKTVMDGLRNIDVDQGFYSYFSRLPERDHVRINDKGGADSENHGKFDEELVHKGTRFVFEIKLLADDSNRDKENWNKLLNAINSPSYRIGSGTRKGFGRIKINPNQSKTVAWNLKEKNDLIAYLNTSSSLNHDTTSWNDISLSESGELLTGWQDFSVTLKARDFFVFSAGFGDNEADSKPKKESYFDWSTGKPKLTKDESTLIPGTSIKGALSHRVAYHYNWLVGAYIGEGTDGLFTTLDLSEAEKSIRQKFDIQNTTHASNAPEWDELEEKIKNLNIDDVPELEIFKDDLYKEVKEKKGFEKPVGENNRAVQELFGFSKNSKEKIDGLRGRVIIEDTYLPNEGGAEKVFSHTSIDRFTNGTIDGALFQEKVSYYQDVITIPIWVEEKAFENEQVKEAFLLSLEDLKNGRLTLGGSASKGHGVFEEIKS